MTLTWGTCGNPPSWCELNSLNLNHNLFDDLEGVYIIWYWDQNSNLITVKVGQGEIKERLEEHRRTFRHIHANVTLYVTWAKVFWPSDRDGVEKFIGDTLLPIGYYPDVDPIYVNLPPWKK